MTATNTRSVLGDMFGKVSHIVFLMWQRSALDNENILVLSEEIFEVMRCEGIKKHVDIMMDVMIVTFFEMMAVWLFDPSP